MIVPLLLALAAAPSEPGTLRIAMAVAAIEDRQPSASDVEQALADTVDKYANISLIKSEELFVLAGQSPLACGPDLDCLELRFRRANADAGLLVVLTPEGDEIQLDWRLIDVDMRKIVARHRTTLSPMRDLRLQLLDVFEEVMQVLKVEPLACVEISTEPSDSIILQMSQDGVVRATGIGRQCLPAGSYQVEATRDGYKSQIESVSLEAGRTKAVHLSLEREKKSLLQSPWFWGIVGAVVVGGAVATGVAIATSGDNCVCVGQEGVPCPPCP